MSAAAGSTSAETEMVTIPAARLAELEALAATAETLRSKLAKRNHSDPERLKACKEANPELFAASSAASSKRFKEKNRDAYNARRRELYRLKKGGGGQGPTVVAQGPAAAATN
jgi:hypothetical protein